VSLGTKETLHRAHRAYFHPHPRHAALTTTPYKGG